MQNLIFEVRFAISQPILTKFGVLIGHDNPQLFVAQIFDIAPLADFWAIFPKFCITGIGQLFFLLCDFCKIYTRCSQLHYEYTL